ncbi:hypothetical protein HTS61_06400 [Escherichia coli]|nr:hypothetical protein [Escherichia coli]
MTQKAISALPHPVNAATGAKYLADDDDFDFSLPGHFPLDWQRVYSSRDDRTEGMFGQGWSVMYEVSLGRTPGTADEKLHDLCVGHGATPWIWRPCCRGAGFTAPAKDWR